MAIFRREFVIEVIDDAGGLCQAGKVVPDGCGGRESATEVHEPFTRGRGGSITDKTNAVAICRRCHSWIHNNPADATKLGLLVSAWQRRREDAST